MSNERPQKSKGGSCLLWGCITVLVLCVLAVVACIGGIWYLAHSFTQYVADTPAKIMILEPTEQEIKNAQANAGPLHVAIEEGKAGTFTVTADDINTLIASEEDMSEARGVVFFRIEEGLVSVDFSLPLAEMGHPGKFLNGTADVEIKTVDEQAKIYIRQVKMNDRKLWGWLSRILRDTDLIQIMRDSDDPGARANAREFDRRVKGMKVEGNTLVITLREDEEAAAGELDVDHGEDEEGDDGE